MPFDGSGNFNRTDGNRVGLYDLGASPRFCGARQRRSDADTHDQDLADGLENCVTKRRAELTIG